MVDTTPTSAHRSWARSLPVAWAVRRAKSTSDATTFAVYAFDTLRIGQKLELNGGARFDRFSLDYQSVAPDGTLSPFERLDEVLTGRVGVVFKPRPNGSIYAGWGNSFNPGADGNTGLSLNASTAELDPEMSESVELGTKWELAGARLMVNAALFRTDKTNARTPGLNPGDPAIVL